MSNKENTQDIVNNLFLFQISANNSIISDNLYKINERLIKIKNSIIDEEENEYENFYNRISFYFSNIITELKLTFVEQIKKYQEKEVELKQKINVS